MAEKSQSIWKMDVGPMLDRIYGSAPITILGAICGTVAGVALVSFIVGTLLFHIGALHYFPWGVGISVPWFALLFLEMFGSKIPGSDKWIENLPKVLFRAVLGVLCIQFAVVIVVFAVLPAIVTHRATQIQQQLMEHGEGILYIGGTPIRKLLTPCSGSGTALQEGSALPHAPSAADPPVKGKCVVIDLEPDLPRVHAEAMRAFWPWSVPSQLDQITSVVFLLHEKKRAGTYSGGTEAYRHVYSVWVVDRGQQAVTTFRSVAGSDPPKAIRAYGESGEGSDRFDEVMLWLQEGGELSPTVSDK